MEVTFPNESKSYFSLETFYLISECPILEFTIVLETVENWETVTTVHLSIGPNGGNRAYNSVVFAFAMCA